MTPPGRASRPSERQLHEVPFGLYNWMEFPPSVNRYLGMLWMGSLLYPKYVDYDLYTEVARYYKLFYHCDLTQEQFDALTANSTGEEIGKMQRASPGFRVGSSLTGGGRL